MKKWENYSPYPPDSYVIGLVSAYVSFFVFKSLVIALILPIFFFVLEATAIVLFYTKGKNLKRATTQFIFLLVMLSPIVIVAWFHLHH